MQYSPTLIDAIREERVIAHKELREKIRDYCGTEGMGIDGECLLSPNKPLLRTPEKEYESKAKEHSSIDWPTRIYRAIVAMFVFLWRQIE